MNKKQLIDILRASNDELVQAREAYAEARKVMDAADRRLHTAVNLLSARVSAVVSINEEMDRNGAQP